MSFHQGSHCSVSVIQQDSIITPNDNTVHGKSFMFKILMTYTIEHKTLIGDQEFVPVLTRPISTRTIMFGLEQLTNEVYIKNILHDMHVPSQTQVEAIAKIGDLVAEVRNRNVTECKIVPVLLDMRSVNSYVLQEFSLDEDGHEELMAGVSVLSMEESGVFSSLYKPACKDAIESLERVKFGGDLLGLDENCAICMEEFLEGIEVVRLPCVHEFHEDCIVDWLKLSHLCPLCRFEMPFTI